MKILKPFLFILALNWLTWSLWPMPIGEAGVWKCTARGLLDRRPFSTEAYGPTSGIASQRALEKCQKAGRLAHACAVKKCQPILWF